MQIKMYIQFQFIALLVILMILTFIVAPFELYTFNQRTEEVRNVRIRDEGSSCIPPLGELPIIPDDRCEDSITGTSFRCYQPDPTLDLVFRISTVPSYYKTICNQFCGLINLNGGCDQETNLYDACIDLLEPAPECLESAKPLGRLTDTNTVYYASGIVS